MTTRSDFVSQTSRPILCQCGTHQTSHSRNWQLLPTLDLAAIRAALSPRATPTARAAVPVPA